MSSSSIISKNLVLYQDIVPSTSNITKEKGILNTACLVAESNSSANPSMYLVHSFSFS